MMDQILGGDWPEIVCGIPSCKLVAHFLQLQGVPVYNKINAKDKVLILQRSAYAGSSIHVFKRDNLNKE